MSSIKKISPTATHVRMTENVIRVDLSDGRIVSVPLEWYPRLVNATREERNNWRMIGRGAGIHWPDLDEDISIAALLAGRPSNESRTSFRRWLRGRPKNK